MSLRVCIIVLISCYGPLIITILNEAKNRAILPSIPAVTYTPGDIRA